MDLFFSFWQPSRGDDLGREEEHYHTLISIFRESKRGWPNQAKRRLMPRREFQDAFGAANKPK